MKKAAQKIQRRYTTLKDFVERALSAKCPWKAEFNGSWNYWNGAFEPTRKGMRSLSTTLGKYHIKVTYTYDEQGCHFGSGRPICPSEVYMAQLHEGTTKIAHLEIPSRDARPREFYSSVEDRLRDLYYRVEKACGKITWTPKTR